MRKRWMTMLWFAAVAVVSVAFTAACGDDSDDAGGENAETKAIIDEWGDAWLDADAARLAALYEEEAGIYADLVAPFEAVGRAEVESEAALRLFFLTYTKVEPTSISYTDTGAVVEWIWGGARRGDPFEFEAQTTFEIEDGLIVRSEDSYDAADAP